MFWMSDCVSCVGGAAPLTPSRSQPFWWAPLHSFGENPARFWWASGEWVWSLSPPKAGIAPTRLTCWCSPRLREQRGLYVIKQRRCTRITIYCYKNNILTLRLWLNVQLYCIWQHWFLRQYCCRLHLSNRKLKALWGSVLGFKEIRNLANNLARCSIQILGALR